MTWFDIIRERAWPLAGPTAPTTTGLLVVAAAVLVGVSTGVTWRVLRLTVTLVHELGHALVGVAVGRRFSGFVVRADMSGHATTTGPARGPGRVLVTWAGYPAPALVAAGAVWLALRGWSAPVVTAALLVTVLSLTRVRSMLTAVVMVATLVGLAALWWWRDDLLQLEVLLGAAFVLLLGGWRHVLLVARAGGGRDDPAVLAALTRIPRGLWILSWLLVHAGATWLVVTQLWGRLRPAG